VFRDYRAVEWCRADEMTLRKAKAPTDGPALLAFLRRQVPDSAQAAELRRRIGELGDRSFKVREKATRELRALGGAAVPALREAAKSDDPETARRARSLLRPANGPSPAALAEAALHLIAYRRPAGAVAALLDFLPAADGEAARRNVLTALAAVARRDGKPDPDLLRALDGPEPGRTAAAAALGRDGGAFARLPGRRLYPPGVTVAHRVEYWTNGEKGAQKHDFTLELLDMRLFNRHDDTLLLARPRKPATRTRPAPAPRVPVP
jgi:hypothetical protein